jgi:lauroyl/myristoyl acyltransferase
MIQSEHDVRLLILAVVATSIAWEGYLWMAGLLVLLLLLLPWEPFRRVAEWFGDWIMRSKAKRVVRNLESMEVSS